MNRLLQNIYIKIISIFNLFGFIIIFTINVNAQETIPIYYDYLADNEYLVHSAAAGIGDCGKLRLSSRQQWAGNEKAPSLQTISFHTRLKEDSRIGLGGIIFKDKNGFHSQFGGQLTFAYHIDMGEIEFSQLSFAISGMYAQNKIDESNFLLPGQFDPIITNLIKTENYFNSDVGIAYHYKTGFAYFTVKNLLLSAQKLEDRTFQSLNVRKYLLNFGYFFDNELKNSIKLEPSIMGQYIERTQEIFIDFNLKAYKKLENDNILWATLSMRRSFDNNPNQELLQITPIIGLNIRNVLISYTYTNELGDNIFADNGYHQFSLGVNLFCKSPRLAACPNINNSFN